MHAAVSTKLDGASMSGTLRSSIRRAPGDFDNRRNDADFLIEFEPGADPDMAGFLDVKEALEVVVGRSVDLVDRIAVEQSRNYLRRRQILRDAEPVYVAGCSATRGSLSPLSIRHNSSKASCIKLLSFAALKSLVSAAGKVSREFHDAHTEISWREIVGMRHRLIHNYADVRLDLVWDVSRNKLPALIAALRPLVPA